MRTPRDPDFWIKSILDHSAAWERDREEEIENLNENMSEKLERGAGERGGRVDGKETVSKECFLDWALGGSEVCNMFQDAERARLKLLVYDRGL